jgi:hypothetical protein
VKVAQSNPNTTSLVREGQFDSKRGQAINQAGIRVQKTLKWYNRGGGVIK